MLAGVTALWASGLALQRLLQHASFGTNAFDLSVFDFMLWSSARGELMMQPLYGGWTTHFGWHFTPILFLWVPFYWVAEGPHVLLLSHVSFGVAFAWMVYTVARDELHDERAAALLGCAALLYKPWLDALLYDFHPELLFAPLLLLLYRSAVQRPRPWLFWAVAAAVLAIKEDAAIYLAGFALLLAWRHAVVRRRALMLALACGVWLLLVLGAVLPAIRAAWGLGETFVFSELWSDLGATPAQVMWTLLTRPARVLSEVDLRASGGAAVSMLLPLLALPLGSRWILGVLPPALVLATADSPVMQRFGLHYGAWLVPFLFLGTVATLARLRERRRGAAGRLPGAVPVAALVLIACLAGTKWNLLRPARYAGLRSRAAVAAAIARIPRDASVAAQSALIPHLPKRRATSMLPRVENADWVLALPSVNAWPQTEAELRRQLASLAPDYDPVATGDDVVLLRRRGS